MYTCRHRHRHRHTDTNTGTDTDTDTDKNTCTRAKKTDKYARRTVLVGSRLVRENRILTTTNTHEKVAITNSPEST